MNTVTHSYDISAVLSKILLDKTDRILDVVYKSVQYVIRTKKMHTESKASCQRLKAFMIKYSKAALTDLLMMKTYLFETCRKIKIELHY